MSSFICPLCSTNRDFSSFAKMFRHITVYHQNEPHFEITCDLQSTCGVVYRTYSAYKSHIYRKHSIELYSTEKHNNNNTNSNDNQQEQNTNIDIEIPLINNDEDEDALDFINDDPESVSSTDYSYGDTSSFYSNNNTEETFYSIKDLKRSYVLFILQLREEFLLPKNVTNVISTYITVLMHHIQILSQKKTFEYSTNDCNSTLSSDQCQVKEVIEFDQLKYLLADVCNAVESITKNEYQFIKHCEEYVGYSSAQEIVVSSPSEAPDYGYFIPLDKTLSLMLNSQSLALKIFENIQQQQSVTALDNDLMFSIRDAYHGIRLDDDHLLIQLYVDDIGLTNPLGSKRDQHKMTMVYFTLEDIPDQYRSKVDFIQLVGICETRILKDNAKAQRFFQPIIDNINVLQLDGLVVSGIHYKFTFSTVVADNLAANSLGGFQSCFSSGYFCRRCYIKYVDKSLLIPISHIKSRTISDHDELVRQILTHPNKSPLMGVVNQSPLHNLIGFNSTTSLPGDCMHDFLEGICPIIIVSLLKQAVSARLITYEYDIDGRTLKIMNSVERISPIIPKFKQQLLFLEEREKLFKKNDDIVTEHDASSSTMATNSSPSLSIITTNSQLLNFVVGTSADVLPKSPTDKSTSDEHYNNTNVEVSFPDEYTIPPVPNALLKDIEDGALNKFGPHYANRQILIDSISYDLIEKYKLFYPSQTQFDKIGTAIVKFLKLPLTKENITIWKDALQTKLKRKRAENSHHIIVQDFRLKYSRSGSGRPLKRRLDETAKRDRYKQMRIFPYDDEISDDIQLKVNQLQDLSNIDIHSQLKLWEETFSFRRQAIKNRSTIDILKDFPGYSNCLLVFEEVKMMSKVDLSAAVRRQVPLLLDKFQSTPVFLTDSSPIRLMKILCKEFGETIHHLFCTVEPPTPYPTLVIINDVFHIYVDFTYILSTNSADDALALLVGMYTIFDLAFDKKSRTIRLLHSALHAETRYLTNTMRILIKDKNIDIYSEQQYQQHQITSNSSPNDTTTTTDESQEQSQVEINSSGDSIIQQNPLVISQSLAADSVNDNRNSNSYIPDDTNHTSNNRETSSNFSSEPQRKRRKGQKQIAPSAEENSTDSIFSQLADHHTSTTNSIPLDDLTNSNVTSKQNKRRRRL